MKLSTGSVCAKHPLAESYVKITIFFVVYLSKLPTDPKKHVI